MKKAQLITLDLFLAATVFFAVLIFYFFTFYETPLSFEKDLNREFISLKANFLTSFLTSNLSNQEWLNFSPKAILNLKQKTNEEIKNILKLNRDFYLNLSFFNGSQVLFKGVLKNENLVAVERYGFLNKSLVKLVFGIWNK